MSVVYASTRAEKNSKYHSIRLSVNLKGPNKNKQHLFCKQIAAQATAT